MRELDFARRLAVQAGRLLRRHQGGPRDIRFKGNRSNLVTDMDHASEEMIVRALRRAFPDHAVVAEERGLQGASRDCWYVDPLDGTTNYAHGFPVYAVSIAYARDGRVQAGAVFAPAFGDLFWASRGGGAFRNGKPIHVGTCPRLTDALVCTGFPYLKAPRRKQMRFFEAFVMRAQAVRRPGAASIDLSWTACGAFDGFWEMCLGPWDMAAGSLILEEAGARLSAFDGSPVDLVKGQVVAANPRLHRQMLAVLRRVGIP
jgi:myo-inositol-1(or 4)-monophosphatase